MYEQLIQNIQDRNLPLSGETINDLIKGHHPSTHLIKGNLDIEDLEVFRDFLQEDLDTLLKGKRAQLGEERTWSGEVFIRTETGWKYKGKAPKEAAPKDEGGDGGKKEEGEPTSKLTPAEQSFLNQLQTSDSSIKSLDGITVQGTPKGNYEVFKNGKKLTTVPGHMLTEEMIDDNDMRHFEDDGDDEEEAPEPGSQLDRHTKDDDPKKEAKEKLLSALGVKKKQLDPKKDEVSKELDYYNKQLQREEAWLEKYKDYIDSGDGNSYPEREFDSADDFYEDVDRAHSLISEYNNKIKKLEKKANKGSNKPFGDSESISAFKEKYSSLFENVDDYDWINITAYDGYIERIAGVLNDPTIKSNFDSYLKSIGKKEGVEEHYSRKDENDFYKKNPELRKRVEEAYEKNYEEVSKKVQELKQEFYSAYPELKSVEEDLGEEGWENSLILAKDIRKQKGTNNSYIISTPEQDIHDVVLTEEQVNSIKQWTKNQPR